MKKAVLCPIEHGRSLFVPFYKFIEVRNEGKTEKVYRYFDGNQLREVPLDDSKNIINLEEDE